MVTTLDCPTCGATGLDLCSYESMMVLREDTALFTLRCPHCRAKISSVCGIPGELRDEVNFAAIELDAGMGRDA